MILRTYNLISDRIRQLTTAAHKLLPHARTALRKPATIPCVLFTAHRAQITLGMLLVFMIYLAPTAVDFLTGIVFPPETSEKVFGLIKTQQAHPLKDVAYVAIMAAAWLGSMVTSMLLFWFHLPLGLTLANVAAKRVLATGDGQTDSAQRRSSFKRAYAIATDPDLESEIETRLRKKASSPVAASSTQVTEVSIEAFDKSTAVAASEASFRPDESPSKSGLAERYELGAQIGSGAMGIVYDAWDKVLDRKVAVKQLSIILSGDDEYILRFRREAKALARLNHPNVVQVYDLIEIGNRLWMVVEYVSGGDLSSYLKERGHLSVSEAVSIVLPVAEGLTIAHKEGIIHRDLKPANILLTDERTPKITDFGIAKLSQSSELTQAGSVLGSPPYMSPEQCSGSSVDTRTDIYALGITLYELISGKVPFEGETASVLARHIVEEPPPLSEVLKSIPPEVEILIQRMLAKSPDERPQDMTAVIDLLSPHGNEISCFQQLK